MRSSKKMPYHIGMNVKLYPSDGQKRLIAINAGAQRSVYNRMVAAGNEIFRLRSTAPFAPAYREHVRYLKETSFTPTGLKTALPYLNGRDVDSQTVDNAIRNYNFAWKNMKESHRGVPVFHKKGYEQSYQTNCHYKTGDTGIFDGSVRFDGMSHMFLPKLGRIRIGASPKLLAELLRSPENRRITTITIQRDAAGDYWCSIAIASETPFRMPLPKTGKAVGIDLNVLDLANLSDGVSFENCQFRRKSAEKLARAQHVLSRRQERAKKENRSLYTSKNYQKQRIKVARIHRQVAAQRSDYLNRVSRNLVENQDLIAAENLQVRNMLKNHRLAGTIQDCGWRTLLTLIQQKAVMYGKKCILVLPQYTTQTCSVCGHVMSGDQKLPLSVREWDCPACGTHHVRDVNAARNILAKALAVTAGSVLT